MHLRGTLPLVGVFLAVTACHTIVEETNGKRPMQNPLSITDPAPLPQTGTTPTPTPGPNPTPTPTPTPTPSPGGTPNPVARLAVRVMFVVCNNVGLPNSENMTTVQVGCKVHLDLNAKDANNKPTDPIQEPEWSYSDESLVDIHEDPWTPYLVAKEEGDLTVTAEADGITSNELRLRFYR